MGGQAARDARTSMCACAWPLLGDGMTDGFYNTRKDRALHPGYETGYAAEAPSVGVDRHDKHTPALCLCEMFVSEVHYPLSSQTTKASLPGFFFKNSN